MTLNYDLWSGDLTRTVRLLEVHLDIAGKTATRLVRATVFRTSQSKASKSEGLAAIFHEAH